MRIKYFNSFLLALWQSQNEGAMFESSRIDEGKSCNQFLILL